MNADQSTKPFSAQEVQELITQDRCLLLDVRTKEAFSLGHIADAINIPFGDSFASWAGILIPREKPLLLILENDQQLEAVAAQLRSIQLTQILGYLENGMSSWMKNEYSSTTLDTCQVRDLYNALHSANGPYVLDVRSQSEWDAGHIQGAYHIPLKEIQRQSFQIPSDKPLAVVCGSGFRSSIACSLLKKLGIKQVKNVIGGMTAWKQAGYS